MIKQSNRLAYLDWMRGLAVVLMIQGHVFDALLRPQDRTSEWFWLSQFLGGLPAPIFLFLVGISLALVLERMRAKAATRLELARKVLRRGGWILLLAYAFRLEQFLVWYPASRWSDVLRVDTLNCIAVSTVIIGLLSVPFSNRRVNMWVLGLATAVAVIITPWVYPLGAGVPGFLLDYINGNSHAWYFSVFPWIAFPLAGMTFGYVMKQEKEFFNRVAVAGVITFAIGMALSSFPSLQYGFFDYSLTSPYYFLIRLGWLLLILYGAYKWSARESAGRWSPMAVMGQASLLVYWLHIDIVYGKPLHDFSQALDVPDTAKQLAWLLGLMLAIACARRIQLTWRKNAVKTVATRSDVIAADRSVLAGSAGLRQES